MRATVEAGRRPQRRGRRRRMGRLLVLALVPLALLVVACIPTTFEYPVDYFNEMHYQQSLRRQEPPRLSVPEGAVPRTGAEAPVTAQSLAQTTNPIQRTPETLAEATRLYQRNCVYCHGPQGQGNGTVANLFRGYNAPVPKPYDDPSVRAMSDGELFAIVTNGLRNEETLVGMPAFQKLLTERERWLLVLQIRAFQGR